MKRLADERSNDGSIVINNCQMETNNNIDAGGLNGFVWAVLVKRMQAKCIVVRQTRDALKCVCYTERFRLRR